MKAMNDYAASLSAEFYSKTPKAVFAAIAVSLANQCNEAGIDAIWDENEQALDALLLAEWTALHNAGIVPQKPPRALLTGETDPS